MGPEDNGRAAQGGGAGYTNGAPRGTDGGAGDGRDRPSGPTLTHSQAINRLHDLRTQMSAIVELENPSDEDDRYFTELENEFREVDGHRRRLERDAALAAVRQTTETLSATAYLRTERGAFAGHPMLQRGTSNPASSGAGYDRDPLLDPDSVDERRFRNPWAFDEVRTFGRDPSQVTAEWHARALSAAERMTGCDDRIRSAATHIIERWDDEDANLARFMLSLSNPDYLRGWTKLFRAGDAAAALTDAERSAIATVRQVARSTRALSLTDTAGGYLVPFQLDPTVVLTANGSVNEIRQAARQVVAIGDTWNGVSANAVTWNYQAESTPVVDTSPTFAQPSIPIYKADGFVPISLEAIQDAANITAEVANLMAEGKDILESSAFAVGSGTAMPTGIVTALTGSPSVVNAASDTALGIADVYKLHGSLPARYRSRSSWLANNLIYNTVRQLGQDLWGSLGQDRPNGLLGRPVLEAEDMDGTISAGADNVLIIGDFSNYVIADRIGMTMEFIPHLFQQATAGQGFGRPTNQRGWLAYVRHGADSINDGAFRMLQA